MHNKKSTIIIVTFFIISSYSFVNALEDPKNDWVTNIDDYIDMKLDWEELPEDSFTQVSPPFRDQACELLKTKEQVDLNDEEYLKFTGLPRTKLPDSGLKKMLIRAVVINNIDEKSFDSFILERSGTIIRASSCCAGCDVIKLLKYPLILIVKEKPTKIIVSFQSIE